MPRIRRISLSKSPRSRLTCVHRLFSTPVGVLSIHYSYDIKPSVFRQWSTVDYGSATLPAFNHAQCRHVVLRPLAQNPNDLPTPHTMVSAPLTAMSDVETLTSMQRAQNQGTASIYETIV
jgi:hypothetical protein